MVLPLQDARLAEHAQRLADFARQHTGAGHALHRVRRRDRGQTVVCVCRDAAVAAATALAEDENIDDD